MEAFLGPLIERQLAQFKIPGATVAVVKDGRLIFSAGYGLADIATSKAVVAEDTLFNIGSVAKLFTTTAVMQLVADGRLDLDADVNTYLRDFEVPARFDQPITLAHLLTHTAGFDEHQIAILVGSKGVTPGLGDYLQRHMPTRIRAPGLQYQYSNYGMSLAGYIVELTSGVPFTRYVEQHVFKPLAMEDSVYGASAPGRFYATAYALTFGNQIPLESFETAITPAGGVHTTATDVARFMIAQLQLGRYEGGRILPEQAAGAMQKTHFQVDAHLGGSAYGFYERRHNGLRILEHAGDALEGFSSLAMLLPKHDIGLFVSYNGREGGRARFQLANAFLDNFFPAKTATMVPPTGFAARAGDYTGTYRLNRHTRTSFLRLVGRSLAMETQVRDNGDGTLSFNYPADLMPPARWTEVKPGLLRRVDAEVYAVFTRVEGSGQFDRLALDAPMQLSLDRVAWHESRGVTALVLSTFLMTFVFGLLVWPLASVIRRLRRRPSRSTRHVRKLKGLAVAFCALALLFLAGYALVVAVQTWGVPIWAHAVFAIPYALILLTIALLTNLASMWRERSAALLTKLYYTLVATLALGFCMAMAHWQMLGFNA